MQRIFIIILTLAFISCSAEGEVPIGEYEYAATHPLPGGPDSMELTGSLTITSAEDGMLEGTWDANRLNPPLLTGDHLKNAYELLAATTYGGTLVHRVHFGAEEISCTGEFVWVAEGGEERSLPVSCTISLDEPTRTAPES